MIPSEVSTRQINNGKMVAKNSGRKRKNFRSLQYKRSTPFPNFRTYLQLSYIISVSYTHLDVYKRQDVDSSASARSVTGVSGVLDERPETSKFNKEIDLSESVAKPDKVHERADGTTEGSVLIKKDNLSRPAECTPGNITIEQFLFSKNGNKQKPSKTESVTMKSEPTVDSMGLEKDDELTHRNDRGRRSFSGFSQGSVENDYSNEAVSYTHLDVYKRQPLE